MAIRRQPTKPPMTVAAAAIVLGGWSARPPDPYAGSNEDDDEVFELFRGNLDAVAALWTQHEAWLRRLAAEWHLEPSWGPAEDMFFGEHARIEVRGRRG